MPSTMSLTWPTVPSGGSRLPSASWLSAGYIGVWIMPGETALTRMPREAYSKASDLLMRARLPSIPRPGRAQQRDADCSVSQLGAYRRPGRHPCPAGTARSGRSDRAMYCM